MGSKAYQRMDHMLKAGFEQKDIETILSRRFPLCVVHECLNEAKRRTALEKRRDTKKENKTYIGKPGANFR